MSRTLTSAIYTDMTWGKKTNLFCNVMFNHIRRANSLCWRKVFHHTVETSCHRNELGYCAEVGSQIRFFPLVLSRIWCIVGSL